jgi:hypothetical protein
MRPFRSVQYRSSAALALMGALVGTAAMAEERRGFGAHEHGHSTLAIAVEGTRVTMTLRAPGSDIVGFKQAAATNEQQAAVLRAKIALADPLALFVLPRVARCRLIKAMAQLETEAHKQGRRGATQAGAEQEGQAEFRAEYALDCANPVALDWIIFRFFESFANARVVEVTLVTGHGRAAFQVGRAMPRIVFEGLT